MTSPPNYVVRGANAANELRLSLDLGIEPIRDLWNLIREVDLTSLAFHGFGGDGPDGVYYWNGEMGLIVINSDKEPLAQQRFTAAHELGHHLLHRKGRETLVIGETDLQAPVSDIQEKEANAFAGYLMAPTKAMSKAFKGKSAPDISAEDIADLMHEFGTTFTTTVSRLHDSGRITASDRDRLLDEAGSRVNFILTAKGYAAEELRPTSLPPKHMLKAVSMYKAGVIDLPRLAELLRMDESEAAKLVSEAEGSNELQSERADPLGSAIEEVFGEAESH